LVTVRQWSVGAGLAWLVVTAVLLALPVLTARATARRYRARHGN
jgi:hypothetical protein